jgi:hypothetical protein
VEPTGITPEPDEAERLAILEALAAEEADRRRAPGWTDTLLPSRRAEDDEP